MAPRGRRRRRLKSPREKRIDVYGQSTTRRRVTLETLVRALGAGYPNIPDIGGRGI